MHALHATGPHARFLSQTPGLATVLGIPTVNLPDDQGVGRFVLPLARGVGIALFKSVLFYDIPIYLYLYIST